MERMLRPHAVVLPEEALMPDTHRITPAPNQFTHELISTQPYYFTGPQQGTPPDGEFPAGSRVVLMVYHGGSSCRVVDSQGIYADIQYDSLHAL